MNVGPAGLMLITGSVMQYKVFCILWEVGSGGCISYPNLCWGETNICSSFLLFWTRYVRYLMAFRCIFFMSFNDGFWDF